MQDNRITRRHFTAGAAAGLAAAAIGTRPATAQDFGGQALIDAAKKEGKIVYYTADFTEPESEIIKAFNKRFPFVKVEMIRAPGGQLITRIKTEAAAGKLGADLIRAGRQCGNQISSLRVRRRRPLQSCLRLSRGDRHARQYATVGVEYASGQRGRRQLCGAGDQR